MLHPLPESRSLLPLHTPLVLHITCTDFYNTNEIALVHSPCMQPAFDATYRRPTSDPPRCRTKPLLTPCGQVQRCTCCSACTPSMFQGVACIKFRPICSTIKTIGYTCIGRSLREMILAPTEIPFFAPLLTRKLNLAVVLWLNGSLETCVCCVIGSYCHVLRTIVVSEGHTTLG